MDNTKQLIVFGIICLFSSHKWTNTNTQESNGRNEKTKLSVVIRMEDRQEADLLLKDKHEKGELQKNNNTKT